MNRHLVTWITIAIVTTPLSATAFDHHHQKWNALLKTHVKWIHNGTASQVDYSGLMKHREQLTSYLNDLSSVDGNSFESWTKPQQLAFLINAYNAFTVELILTRYPHIKSIKDLGFLFSSPWKKKFFTLLGEKRHLDDIEHGMIRKKGVYNEPRIHAAVVCASIGCPALRDEAFTFDQLDKQLQDSLERFLSDRTRNRYNPDEKVLEVSKIFDWYGGDFTKPLGPSASLADVFVPYAHLLADAPTHQQWIREKKIPVRFLDYDWSLNDIRP